VQLLEDVESRGIVGIDGNRVRYSHPLLARSVYTDASGAMRRATHRALAGVVDQPELKARHLAMAATSADPATLQALDDAAEVARTRGAPAAAAEMLELAIGLGGDTPLRRLKAADHHFQAGEAARAAEHLQPTIDQLPPGPLRSVALSLRAGMRIYENGFADAVRVLKQALDDADGVPQLVARTTMLLGLAQGLAGESTRD